MRPPAGIVAVVLIGALSACATPGYSASKLQRGLEDAGVPADRARCVTKALEDTFDVNQLASISEPTFEEMKTTREILVRCEVKNLNRLP